MSRSVVKRPVLTASAESIAVDTNRNAGSRYGKIARNKSAKADRTAAFLGRENRKNTPKNDFGASAIPTYVDYNCNSGSNRAQLTSPSVRNRVWLTFHQIEIHGSGWLTWQWCWFTIG